MEREIKYDYMPKIGFISNRPYTNALVINLFVHVFVCEVG